MAVLRNHEAAWKDYDAVVARTRVPDRYLSPRWDASTLGELLPPRDLTGIGLDGEAELLDSSERRVTVEGQEQAITEDGGFDLTRAGWELAGLGFGLEAGLAFAGKAGAVVGGGAGWWASRRVLKRLD
jgi:hypothetical protein